MRILYSILSYLLLPLAVVRLFFLSFKNSRYRERFSERLGFVSATLGNKDIIWMHAVSVGEVQASQSLVSAIKSEYPHFGILITTATPTGAETVQQVYRDSVQHCYQPYDTPDIISRFLSRLKPKCCLLMETELWPNTIHYCDQYAVPVFLLNGRMSRRSARRYAYFHKLTSEMLKKLAGIAAQSDEDARQLSKLGASENSLVVTGSLKFDLSVDESLITQAKQLKQEQYGKRPVWIAASTHEGEEILIIRAHKLLLKQLPECLLILAPRHPVRREEVIQLIEQEKLSYASRKKDSFASQNQSVFLLDTLGELMFFYAVSDCAFVGGSLIEHGGHNPIEPAVLSLPVLVGPHHFNFKTITENLIRAGGAYSVEDEQILAEKVQAFLLDRGLTKEVGRNACEFADKNRGATKRVLNVLQPYLD